MEPVRLPKLFRLKNGSEVLIREMTLADEPGIIDFFRQLPLEDRHFLRNDVTDPIRVHRFMTNYSHDRVRAYVAVAGERIVGSADIERSHLGWTMHVGEIRVVVAREFQHQGLGTMMTRLLLSEAVGSGIEKVVAETSTDQKNAMFALEKLKFRKEATLKRHVRDLAGRKHDLVIYTYDVSHIWDNMEALVSDYSPMQGD